MDGKTTLFSARRNKETTMFGPKKLLTMAALAMIAAAGVAGTASAQPARHDGWPAGYHQDIRRDDHAPLPHILRSHDLRMIGTPRLVRGDRYTVRVQDRHGRTRMVQVNAHNGRVIRL